MATAGQPDVEWSRRPAGSSCAARKNHHNRTQASTIGSARRNSVHGAYPDGLSRRGHADATSHSHGNSHSPGNTHGRTTRRAYKSSGSDTFAWSNGNGTPNTDTCPGPHRYSPHRRDAPRHGHCRSGAGAGRRASTPGPHRLRLQAGRQLQHIRDEHRRLRRHQADPRPG